MGRHRQHARRGDAVPPEARDLLKASPRADALPKPPKGTPRRSCTDGRRYSLSSACWRPATWAVDGKPLCLWHAWQAVRPRPES